MILTISFGSCQQSSSNSAESELESKQQPTAVSKDQSTAPMPILLVMKNGYYGFADTAGNWIIEPHYGHALPFSNGVSCVNMQGLDTFSMAEPEYRYINLDQEPVLPSLQFQIPSFFYEGVGQVHLDNGAFILFNRDGKPLSAQVKGAALFHEGLAASQHPVTMQVGFMDKSGHWVFQLEGVESVGDFHQGLAYIQRNGKYGYINSKGEEVIATRFEKARDFSENLAAVKQDELWGFINPEGKVVVQPQFDGVSDFQEGAAAVMSSNSNGYITPDGKWLFNPKKLSAEALQPFSEGLAGVKKNGKWGFIRVSGNFAIPPKFQAITDFHFNRAIVIDNNEARCIKPNGQYLDQLDGVPMSVYHHPDSSNIPYPLFE